MVSVFKTKGVILKIEKLREKEFLYTIFTSDYGKIKCAKKRNSREKTLDLWFIINFEVLTKTEKNIHTIRNIKIQKEFHAIWQSYELTNSFLELINIWNIKIPEWNPIMEIYWVYDAILWQNSPRVEQIVLCWLKIYDILWELQIEHSNLTVKKILHFIHWNNIETILKLTWIHDEIRETLKSLLR